LTPSHSPSSPPRINGLSPIWTNLSITTQSHHPHSPMGLQTSPNTAQPRPAIPIKRGLPQSLQVLRHSPRLPQPIQQILHHSTPLYTTSSFKTTS
jgi:hypothetical protein